MHKAARGEVGHPAGNVRPGRGAERRAPVRPRSSLEQRAAVAKAHEQQLRVAAGHRADDRDQVGVRRHLRHHRGLPEQRLGLGGRRVRFDRFGRHQVPRGAAADPAPPRLVEDGLPHVAKVPRPELGDQRDVLPHNLARHQRFLGPVHVGLCELAARLQPGHLGPEIKRRPRRHRQPPLPESRGHHRDGEERADHSAGRVAPVGGGQWGGAPRTVRR